ncbi:MAG: IPExxxVDY family protein [Flavobacteriales bacterium]|nr:IPExxxVDY family protein [Flavobacteriales bacterium]
MSKHRLVLDDDYEFLAFGLSCHWKDYRVAWLMNRSLKKDFHREVISVKAKDGTMEEFTKFIYRDLDARLNYILLSNHNEEAYLFKEHKQYDYFMLIEGYIDIFDAETFQRELHLIEGIQFIAPMDTGIFKRIQYTLFEE